MTDGIDPHEALLAVLEIRKPGAELLDHPADICMGQHRPFACPGRAIRVDEGGRLLPAGGNRNGVVGVFPDDIKEGMDAWSWNDLQVQLTFHIGEKLPGWKGEVVVDVARDDRLDLCCGPDLQHAGQQEIKGNEKACVGVVELGLQLLLRVEGVVHHRDGAEAIAGMVGDHMLGHIGQQSRHLVPFPDAKSGEGPREAIDQGFQLPKRDLPAQVVEGDSVGEPPGRSP